MKFIIKQGENIDRLCDFFFFMTRKVLMKFPKGRKLSFASDIYYYRHYSPCTGQHPKFMTEWTHANHFF